MFSKLLIANRGAIACRIARTLRDMQVNSVAVYSEADLSSLHVREADEAISLGEGPAAQTYLDSAKIIDAALRTGAQAIHPGYGFLSENAAFAEACEAAGLIFVGPTPQQLRTFGLKHTARALAHEHGVPMPEGTGLLANAEDARQAAATIGYPVMLKSTAGGGGIGMRVCHTDAELIDAFEAVQRLGQNNFSDAGVFLEKYIARARHLEVQIFGDGSGSVIALGVRDCSVQRRNQKVIEETPAPNLPAGMAAALCEAAVALGEAAHYRSAGTVEFVYDSEAQRFYFLEVNTRLQVEHGVTEQVWGVDLVLWMIALAAGELPALESLKSSLTPRGHAIQARLYAEDPGRQFQPSSGLLTDVHFPLTDGKTLRIDRWIEAGCDIPPFFDPMLAKVIAWQADRDQAINALSQALAETRLYGVETNRAYLQQILTFLPFRDGHPWTRCLEQLNYQAATVEVLTAGTQTTVQDYPGRLGYWSVGVPPSGPMDSRALRLGNRLLGNPEGEAALEITLSGPQLKFNTQAYAAICGAEVDVTLDGEAVPLNRVFRIAAGATLKIGAVSGAGVRSYLCLQGGFTVPDYLGSKSTFTLGQFGGHAGRALRSGDILHITSQVEGQSGAALPEDLCPSLPEVRTLRVLYGPHGAPEFFSAEYITAFFATDWEIHFNSSRTGVRLIGPKPVWARESGGEAGLHPSNIHDNPYAVGAVDFTGDMPVILGPDGPSLGGFVCPVTVIEADLWQLGQLKAGDKIRFVAVDYPTARQLAIAHKEELASLIPVTTAWQPAPPISPIICEQGEADQRLVARLSGDTHVLFEAGDAELDLVLRFRIHALMQRLETTLAAGVIDITPGIRSLQIHYLPEVLPLTALLDTVFAQWATVCTSEDLQVPTRVVHLPLSWDDPACRKAIDKYMTTVRQDAPWCPDNLEFIRRINDLPDKQAVWDTVFDASYLVMGLGDVYLGAPVATPLDPRHRLVTTKYNPARTWTAENSVGIGGAYLCVYGMEGPGGYQFVGRTLQMWNRYHEVADFGGKPWLLRFFDQLRFYPVSAEELLSIRRDFPLGRYPLRIENSTLRLADYQQFLTREAQSIAAFKSRQQQAFDAERERWIATGQAHYDSHDAEPEPQDDAPLALSQHSVDSPVAGNVWQVTVAEGQRVHAGDVLMIMESMKMEIPLHASCDGRVKQLGVEPGSSVRAGQRVAIIDEK